MRREEIVDIFKGRAVRFLKEASFLLIPSTL